MYRSLSDDVNYIMVDSIITNIRFPESYLDSTKKKLNYKQFFGSSNGVPIDTKKNSYNNLFIVGVIHYIKHWKRCGYCNCMYIPQQKLISIFYSSFIWFFFDLKTISCCFFFFHAFTLIHWGRNHQLKYRNCVVNTNIPLQTIFTSYKNIVS